MARPRSNPGTRDPAADLGFLLSQVGSHSSARFAEGLEPLGLKPPHVGILRVVAQADGLSQQALADRLGIFPSRLVGLIDDLSRLGLIERRPSPADRRSHALYLTEAGREALRRVDQVSIEIQANVFAALEDAERAELAGFLRRIVAQQGLTPGIHPGYGHPEGGAKSC